jgi:hypothetical protein
MGAPVVAVPARRGFAKDLKANSSFIKTFWKAYAYNNGKSWGTQMAVLYKVGPNKPTVQERGAL